MTSDYTVATSGFFRLAFEVANTIDCTGQSALATDNILLNGNPLFNFQPGGVGVLPTGLMGFGTFGTSAAIAGLAPSGGDAAFAWLDSTGSLAPIYDTVDGFSASRVYSVGFATAGSTLSLDAAFLTSDGGPFDDYGIIAQYNRSLRTFELGSAHRGSHRAHRDTSRQDDEISRAGRSDPESK